MPKKSEVNGMTVNLTRPAPPHLPPWLLFSMTFLLVFGPRLFGYYSLDLLMATAFVSFLALLVLGNLQLPYPGALYLPLFLFGTLLLYSLFVVLLSDTREFFYPLKATRVAANYLGVYALCVFYRYRFGKQGMAVLFEHLFWAISLHALIMIVGYASESFLAILASIAGYERIAPYRVSGLTISYQSLALVQGFGFFLGLLSLKKPRAGWRAVLFLPALAVSSFAIFLAGRTALFYITAILLTLLVFQARAMLLNVRFVGALAFGLFVGLAGYRLLDSSIKDRLDVTLAFVVQPVEAALGARDFEGTYAAHVSRRVLEMYFLPADPRILLFGSSVSGRGKVYVPSDVGYVLLIHGLGVFGSFLVLLFYLGSFVVALRWLKHDRATGILFLFLTAGVLFLSFKEQILLTRHGFTLSAVFLCSWHLWGPRTRSRVVLVETTLPNQQP